MTDIILSIISALGGILAGGISSVLYFRQERKSKDIENEARQSEEWRKLYELERDEVMKGQEKYNEMVQRKDLKIDGLYKDISRLRDEKADLNKKIALLEVERTRHLILKCEKPGCPQRHPPTGY